MSKQRLSRRQVSALLLVLIITTITYQHYSASMPGDACDASMQNIPLRLNKDVYLPTVCLNSTCKAAFEKHLQLPINSKFYPIPAIRHLIWMNESVSAYFAGHLRTWQKIHPDWTVVLWRDEDLKPFVRKHFPGALDRFLNLEPDTIMQVDMIRFMLLYKYGGVYADLDYTLAASLDEYRKFYAVVTREPEAHSMQFWGLIWPPRTMANSAFLMSAPGHAFYRHCIERLQSMPYAKSRPLSFAGPLGLTQMLEAYSMSFPRANSPLETVYVPPSHSFYPYEGNRLKSSQSIYLPARLQILTKSCGKLPKSAASPELQEYCKDVNNLDAITDKSQPIVAVHDMQKTGAIYDGSGAKFFFQDLINIRKIIPNVHIGRDWT